MFGKLWFNIKALFKRLWKAWYPDPLSAPSVRDAETSIDIINDKIKLLKGTNKNSINLVGYQRYFDFYEKLGLREEFTILTIKDNLLLSGSVIQPVLINQNKNKVVIFCHGVTNNRWSLFYTMHLVLQRGYQAVTYDARNHGISSKFSTSLGQIEACDLQDVITYVKRKYQPEKIGLYGFSMGAATCLFWLSYFAGSSNSEVVFTICEAPFDYFARQKRRVLGTGVNPNHYWKRVLLDKIVKELLSSSYDKLEKVNPFLALPQRLPIKLLLLHGLEDSVLDWRATSNIYHQLIKEKSNKGKVNLYFCRNADHGDLPFIADFVPNSLRWKGSKRISYFTFTTLLCKYLEKNL
jgi:hypothetical protein